MKTIRKISFMLKLIFLVAVLGVFWDCKNKAGESPFGSFLGAMFSKPKAEIPAPKTENFAGNVTPNNISDEAIALGVVNLNSSYTTDPAPTTFVP
ncbi:MAG: hypothetical protein N3A69_11710, partial [Leptospiraceae bacterium]|nr:hypothetical protein [Leptospiraceae bacterium]